MTPLPEDPKELSQQAHRRLIGVLGFSLPFLLYLIAGLRPTTPLVPWRLLDSVSAYYYTGSVAVFTGVLFALSLFLFTYPGYDHTEADRLVGRIGGLAAVGVALFPTAAPAGLTEPPWWSKALRAVHYSSAVVLFICFILFSIWLFRKSNVPNRKDRPLDKRVRDAVCLGCGLVMIASLLWAARALDTHGPIFWPEAIAIVAFAISWLVKGEAYRPMLAIFRRVR